MARKYTYHRENCDTHVREIIIDSYERTIVLSGQHAFEWSISVYTKHSVTKTVYPSRKVAREEFRKYKRKR